VLCFRCGSHNPDGSEFCSQCGQQFLGGEAASSESSSQQKASAKAVPVDEGVVLEIGSQVAERYEIKSLLGHGPVGSVYRAHDLEIDVVVALKMLSPKLLQTKEDQKTFLGQIRAARKINHPNVIRLYDEDSDEGRVFFTMQMLEGLSLRKIIGLRKDKEQGFNLKEITPIFSHICQALEKAHEATVHGDLKPENIIVLPDMLKVTDFGLLDALPRRPFVAAQQTDLGGYAYLAPEIRASERDIKPAADIYAMGVILCEMLSGEVYKGATSGLPRLDKSLGALLPLIKRALNENPGKRHRSTGEFFDELDEAIGSKSPSKKPPRPAPSRKEDKPAKSTKSAKPAKSGPPGPPPPRRKGLDPEELKIDPPTVVNASIQKDPTPIKPEPPRTITDEAELIDEVIGDDAEPAMARDATDRIPHNVEAMGMDDEETAIADTGSAPLISSKARVARPIEEAQSDNAEDDVSAVLKDEPAPVQVLEKPPASQPIMPAIQAQTDPRPATEPIRRTPGTGPLGQGPSIYPNQPPPYGTQPPYPYSQPPPAPSRTPVYIFLSVFLIIVGVVAYFVIDYLLTLKANLVTPPAQTAIVDGGQPAADKPKLAASDAGPIVPKHDLAAKDAEAKKAAAKKAEAIAATQKAAEESRKAEELRRAQDAILAVQKAKAEQARKEEEALKAKQDKAPEADKARLAEQARQAKARRQAEEKRLADQRRRTEEARKAAKRRAEEKRQAEIARRKAEAKRKAEQARLAASSLPTLEEVPDDGSPPAPVEPKPVPTEPIKETKETVAATPSEPAAKSNCPKGMVFVPTGRAWIGSASNDPMRNFGEKRLHKVDFSKGFCVDRYEYPNAAGHKPRVKVSWKQARAMCKRKGKRLCTEDEWEYACKGKGNRSFPYGQSFDAKRCNTEDAQGEDRSVASCGTFQRCRSPFGAIDMSGNVSEWTASKYQPNSRARTHKGGSATRPNWAVRCASRSSLSPSARKADLGFRCCK